MIVVKLKMALKRKQTRFEEGPETRMNMPIQGIVHSSMWLR